MFDDVALGTPVASPSATIAVRRVQAISAVIITVRGAVGHHDAEVLGRLLQEELPPASPPRQGSSADRTPSACSDGGGPEGGGPDGGGPAGPAEREATGEGALRGRGVRGTGEGAGPSVMVVDLGGATIVGPLALTVLSAVRERARWARVGLHILHRGRPGMHRQLCEARLAPSMSR